MISVYMLGGLGNQMFQYSVGRALSLRLNTGSFLELAWFLEKHPNRKFELDKYNINVSKTFSGKIVYSVTEVCDSFGTDFENSIV